MKNILLLSLLIGTLLSADKVPIPMSASLLSIDNSGQLNAMDAYKDGIGIYIVDQIGGNVTNNYEMNTLVYKYGTEAKIADVNIKDYVLSNGSIIEKDLAVGIGKFKPIMIANGTVCSDSKENTYQDKYTNGSCNGVTITSCLDAYNKGLTSSGLYVLTNYEENINAYCDQKTSGGGWTLVLKLDDNDNVMQQNSIYWNIINTKNDLIEEYNETTIKTVKFNTANKIPFNKIMAKNASNGRVWISSNLVTMSSFTNMFATKTNFYIGNSTTSTNLFNNATWNASLCNVSENTNYYINKNRTVSAYTLDALVRFGDVMNATTSSGCTDVNNPNPHCSAARGAGVRLIKDTPCYGGTNGTSYQDTTSNSGNILFFVK